MEMGKEILDILRKEKRYLQENFGLLSIGLFGSYAKGKQRPDSDINVIVELAEPRFDFLVGLQIHLEDRLGKPVEVIRKRKGLSERFLRRVVKDVHYV
jgi:predicted nucleotidyltransferase